MPEIFKSKTFWGTVLGAAAYLLGQPHIGPTEVLTAISGISITSGLRDAWAKGGKY